MYGTHQRRLPSLLRALHSLLHALSVMYFLDRTVNISSMVSSCKRLLCCVRLWPPAYRSLSVFCKEGLWMCVCDQILCSVILSPLLLLDNAWSSDDEK